MAYERIGLWPSVPMCDQLEPFFAILNEQYLPSRYNLHKEFLKNRLEAQEVLRDDVGNFDYDNYSLAHKGHTSAYARGLPMRVPKWVNFVAIGEKFAEAKQTQSTTGVKHAVDHIVPLNGLLVCGLHCAENMAVITKIENLQKSWHRWPDIPDYSAMPKKLFKNLTNAA
jgi:hypothetical protein